MVKMVAEAGKQGSKDGKGKTRKVIAEDESWEDRAGWLSGLTLSFLTPLLRKGTFETLEAPDLGRPADFDKASASFERYDAAWQREVQLAAKKRRMPSVLAAQMRSVGCARLSRALVCYIATASLQFVPVLALNVMVQHFEGSGYQDLSFGTLMGITMCLLLLPIVGAVCQTQHDIMMVHAGLQSRTAVAVAVYKHALRLTSAARQGVSTGEVVNLFSNDALKVEAFMRFMAFIFVAPVQVGVCLYLIHSMVGDAMYVGLGFMIFLVPIQGVVFGTLIKKQKQFVKLTDKRVGIMNEVLAGIRIVKYYGWEAAFKDYVAKMRQKEIAVLTRIAYTVAIGFSMILLSAPIVQPVLIFSFYTRATGKDLDAATAFTTISLFNLLRFPFAFLPMGIVQYLNCSVASRRLAHFLTRAAITDYVEEVDDEGRVASIGTDHETTRGGAASSAAARELAVEPSCALSIQSGTFSWGVMEPLEPPRATRSPRRKQRQPKKVPGDDSAGTSERQSASNDIELTEVYVDEPPRQKGGEGEGEHKAPSDEATAPVDEQGPQSQTVDAATLSDITLNVRAGELLAVIGAVGSGKSSLLSAISGEMQRLEGSVARRKGSRMAVATQVPWIVNRTLRENVVFGSTFDADRYAAVIQACGLAADIAILPGGDETEIGEKGINLSGGQKARVALARAAYSSANIFLLDDPLSAVDAHVGKTIFDKCIGGVLDGTTRILVTHQLQFLERCDRILVMENGRVTHIGTFGELLRENVPLVVSVSLQQSGHGERQEEETQGAGGSGHLPHSDAPPRGEQQQQQQHNKPVDRHQLQKRGALTGAEERKVGQVESRAYTYYARTGGWTWVIVAIMFMFAGRASEVVGSFWLSRWAEETAHGDGLTMSQSRSYLTGYALFAVGGVLGLTLRALSIARHRLGASVKLHSNLVKSIMGAPVSFFDITPIGRILNRFAADIQTIDTEISQAVSQIASCVTNVTGAIAAISAATKGTFVILMIPLAIIYYHVQHSFRATSTEVERLSKISRSPIFSDFSQTLNGAASIRAYRAQSQFLGSALNAMDLNNACVIVVQLCFSWLSIRLDVIGATIQFFIVCLAVVTKDFIPAGWIGLALSFAIELTGFLKHAVRMVASVEGNMASVERVMTYTEEIESEGQVAVPSGKGTPAEGQESAVVVAASNGEDLAVGGAPESISAAWPSEGRIAFRNVVMGYREGPDVLKRISFQCAPREKIGIVGRTGSGKSSILVAMFRIVELRSGSITIDDKDIARIPLTSLRRRLCIIPQDPVMFSSTIRFNLDPFDEHDDARLWEVLEQVQLRETVKALPQQLGEPVAEGGENFSVGQRQLICIARAMLRKPRILVLDEATASIDNETDAIIQAMIKTEFKDVTVLTIAHRLHTIMDSGRILVLSNGEVAEFGTPTDLLGMEAGIFKAMVDAASAQQT